MLRPQFACLPAALAIVSGIFSVACSGQIEPTTTSGSSSGSSSGVASSSGSNSGSGSGSGSSSSGTGPNCGDLGLPAIAEQCPDGSYAPAEYVVQNGQCVITYTCPTSPPGPLPFPPPSPAPLPPSPSPSPPACTAMLPNQCASCLALPQICEVCSTGQTECAHYVLQNYVCGIEVCPPGSGGKPLPPSPPNPPSPPVEDAGTGIPGCSQGDPCSFSPNAATGCGGGPIAGGCYVDCTCGSAGYLDCATTCPSTGGTSTTGP